MEGNKMPSFELYLTSFYFTITTITTVGYGDISGKTKGEKFYCALMMVFGVLSFSFASGALASILQNLDAKTASFDVKMTILN